ncbi:MAG: 3'-5' exonuclease [Oscillospiraceae bacterium]|nr:3'-5' exonuclease [Oscillospiraceae bacterium]
MDRRIVVFDVETPNQANDRMSAIGVTVVEGGAVTAEWGTLVDPECAFDRFNVRLTGITPQAVRGAPRFPELWPRLEPLFDGAVLAAHNAPFDLSVLARCLSDYGVVWRRTAEYVCTCRMSRACWPGMENHRLDTVCGALGIDLFHHNAASDSRAAAEILLACRRLGTRPERFLRQYDLALRRTL